VTIKSSDGLEYEVLRTKEWKPKTKPTIIFYHGFPDNKFSFISQMKHFENLGFNVVCPPLRGYEPSYIPEDGDYSLLKSG
jgi:pimeloyl-ACP methyl ester carboxylesterase